MTKWQIERQIDAVRSLRSYYRLRIENPHSRKSRKKGDFFKDNYLNGCPLCSASVFGIPHCDLVCNCKRCLWVMFDGRVCFEGRSFDESSLRSRIARLNRWEKKLIEMRGAHK